MTKPPSKTLSMIRPLVALVFTEWKSIDGSKFISVKPFEILPSDDSWIDCVPTIGHDKDLEFDEKSRKDIETVISVVPAPANSYAEYDGGHLVKLVWGGVEATIFLKGEV